MASELKPCPCGEKPTGLDITDGSQGGKYHYVSGDCCGEWIIEFRANYTPVKSSACMALATEAWNSAPRKRADERGIELELAIKERFSIAMTQEELAQLVAIILAEIAP